MGCLGLVVGVAQAGQPQPPAVVYGQIRDEYGRPMDSGAEVVVVDQSNGSNECGRYVLDGPIYVGMNYRISIPLEDAVPLLRPNAALSGSSGKIKVLIDGSEQPLVPAGAFAIPQPGGVLKMDFSIAQDTDNDGLPDAWELLMVAWSGGLFSSITDIDPNADFDGDGMSNYREYLAGTFPFLATDIFEITRSDPDSERGRIALSFTTVAGRKYHVLMSGRLGGGDWVQTASSRTSDGGLEYQIFDGTGRQMTVYVDGSCSSAFFRVGAN
jgi:hypothetical protein